ncbi:MAG: SagB/ThcOx family dehydrogenase [Parcubacteria group bacterium]|nr:SagB/ThcOx family dehydrogenase [Parcubacteria group bacterium]
MIKNPLFEFFERNRPFIDKDSSKWPETWKTIKWKVYPRHPRLFLPRPRLKKIFFDKVILNRKSSRDFSKKAITLQEIGSLLFYSCGLIHPNNNLDHSRRAQPSGGGLYPLELYVLILNSNDIKAGAYHYNVLEHSLEELPVRDLKVFENAFHYPWVLNASLVVLMSFVERRTRPKYGNLAYKLGLMEAGHIGQNIYLNCSALGLRCCALGGLNSDVIDRELGFDGISETIFYAIAVGK